MPGTALERFMKLISIMEKTFSLPSLHHSDTKYRHALFNNDSERIANKIYIDLSSVSVLHVLV